MGALSCVAFGSQAASSFCWILQSTPDPTCTHRPADAQREGERETVYDGEKGQCRALVSVHDSAVQEVCANFEETFGLGPKAMKGRTLATIFGPEPDIQSFRLLLDTVKLGMIKEHTFKTYSMQGNPMETHFHAQPWCSDIGQVTHVMLSFSTIARRYTLKSTLCLHIANILGH